MIPDSWPLLALLLLAMVVVLRRRKFREERDCKICMYNVDGGCRRYPPQRVYTGSKLENPQAMDVTVFPVVMNATGWWCGEYRRKD